MLTILHRYERKSIVGMLASDDVIVQHKDGTFAYGDGEPCPGVANETDMAELLALGNWEEVQPPKVKARRKGA